MHRDPSTRGTHNNPPTAITHNNPPTTITHNNPPTKGTPPRTYHSNCYNPQVAAFWRQQYCGSNPQFIESDKYCGPGWCSRGGVTPPVWAGHVAIPPATRPQVTALPVIGTQPAVASGENNERESAADEESSGSEGEDKSGGGSSKYIAIVAAVLVVLVAALVVAKQR